jgi:hypothetical protein
VKKCLEVLKAATAHNSGIILQNHYFFLFFQIPIFSISIFRYSYYRSSIADKISDYEDIWEPKSERCLSPAESELQFKAYLANKLTQNNGFEDDLPSSYCSSDTTGPRSSSSTTGLSSLNESLESITSSISEESSTGFLETENGMLIVFLFES